MLILVDGFVKDQPDLRFHGAQWVGQQDLISDISVRLSYVSILPDILSIHDDGVWRFGWCSCS